MEITKLNKSYELRTESGKLIGTFQLDIDGSYYFWEDSNISGCWTSHALREIADKLDEINKPFEKELEIYFDEKKAEYEEEARIEYKQLLYTSEMFFEFYPNFTGDYIRDKDKWLVEYKKLVELREEFNFK